MKLRCVSVTASQKKNYLPVCLKILNNVFDTRCWIYITKWHTCVIFCRLLALIAFLLCCVWKVTVRIFIFSYHVHTGIYAGHEDTIQQRADHHFLHRILPVKTSFEKFVMCQANSRMSLEEQETIIISLPNDSTPQGRTNNPYDAYFSTGTIVENDDIMTRSKYIPSSVRNKILYYCRLNALDDILQTLLHVKSTQEKKSRHSCASQRHSRRTTSTFECPDSQYDFEPVTHAVQEETTPYVKFLQHLVQCTLVSWHLVTCSNPNPEKKILDALQEANVSVVLLDSDPRFHRFSVLTPDMSSCTVGILQGNYVSCQSGRCRATKGHSRKIIKNIWSIKLSASSSNVCQWGIMEPSLQQPIRLWQWQHWPARQHHSWSSTRHSWVCAFNSGEYFSNTFSRWL